MLKSVLHRIVAIPQVYDLVQFLAGQGVAVRRVARQVENLNPRLVMDIGGGTGAFRKCCPNSMYICLDMDMLKLQGYRRHYPDGVCILGDGTRTPIKSGSLDLVMCMAVLHHIPDELTPLLMAEVRRVLKPDGKLLLWDPVWKPKRLPGRLLWRYDRGSHPRTPEAIKSLISSSLQLLQCERFAVYHEYLLCVAGNLDGAHDVR